MKSGSSGWSLASFPGSSAHAVFFFTARTGGSLGTRLDGHNIIDLRAQLYQIIEAIHIPTFRTERAYGAANILA